VVALVTIQDQEAVSTDNAVFRVFIEVSNPFQTSFVRCPSIIGRGDYPILW
jgi:hypothetical protein